MTDPAFPFAVEPSDKDAAGPSREDARGPDTVNRILLHGARHHDREALFLRWGQGRKGWGWSPTPDWRADRAELERGVWSLGAASVPVDPAWPLARVAEVLADAEPVVLFAPSLDRVRELEIIGGRPEGLRAVVPRRAPEPQGDDWLSLAKFLEYGGVQDTPERASMWRTFARSVGPDVVASLEYPHPARSPRALKFLGAKAGPPGGARVFARLLPPRSAQVSSGAFPPASGRPA